MDIEIFTLCKYAELNNNSLAIIGIFDVINTPQLPIVLNQCNIALHIRFTGVDLEKHHFQVRVLSPEGKDVISRVEADYQNTAPSPLDTSTTSLVLAIAQLKIETFGKHSIVLSVDGHQQRAFPLYVLRPNPPRA